MYFHQNKECMGRETVTFSAGGDFSFSLLPPNLSGKAAVQWAKKRKVTHRGLALTQDVLKKWLA